MRRPFMQASQSEGQSLIMVTEEALSPTEVCALQSANGACKESICLFSKTISAEFYLFVRNARLKVGG